MSYEEKIILENEEFTLKDLGKKIEISTTCGDKICVSHSNASNLCHNLLVFRNRALAIQVKKYEEENQR